MRRRRGELLEERVEPCHVRHHASEATRRHLAAHTRTLREEGIAPLGARRRSSRYDREILEALRRAKAREAAAKQRDDVRFAPSEAEAAERIRSLVATDTDQRRGARRPSVQHKVPRTCARNAAATEAQTQG